MNDNNSTSINVQFKNSVKQQDKLDRYIAQLQTIYGFISGLNKTQVKALANVGNAAKEVKEKSDEASNSLVKLGKQFNLVFNVKTFTTFVKSFYSYFRKAMEMTSKSSSYIENVNLLEVAYHNANEEIEVSSQRIETFISKMADVYGLDENRLTRQFGIFKQLANAMELPTETAENLSEIMVKMTNDIASLYNLDLDRASNALQSALVGQVRPIRGATGADITEKTLQKTIDRLGMDTTISDLSFVEKRLVMVISLTEQLKNAQGDYARTISSVSNQIRIMHEQWERLSRAVSNSLYAFVDKYDILAYVNGVLMALTEIFNIVASLLGFKMPEFDYSGLSGVSDEAQDIIEGMDGAGASVDKLKDKLSGLRAFDKLNVVTTPKDKDDSSSIGGIDSRILAEFNKQFGEYNDMMDKVNLRAREIRDRILEWLGVTDGSYDRLKKIWKVIKGIAITIAGIKLTSSVLDFLNWWTKNKDNLSKAVGITLLISGLVFTYDALNKELNGDQSLGTALEGLVGGLSAAGGAYMITKSVTVALAVAAITLVPQAVVEVKNLFTEDINPFIEENGGFWKTWWEGVKIDIDFVEKKVAELKDDIFSKFADIAVSITGNEEEWNGWKRIIENIWAWFRGDWGTLTSNFKEDFGIINDEVQKNGGYWESWKAGVKEIWENTKKWFEEKWNKSSFKNVNDAIQENGGWWTSWKNGVKEIWNNLGLSKFFTKEYWSDKFSSMVNGAKEALSKLKEKFENWKANLKTPHIEWTHGNEATGWIKDVLETLHLPTSLPKLNVNWYANGGLPPVGQLFVANEKGPELVGNIGGQSFVANQNQMMDLLDKKMGGGQPINPTFIIQVGDEKIANVVLENLQDMAKTNGRPIVIGG